MRPLRYSINVSLDGCVDHAAAFVPDEAVHHHAAAWIASNDVALFGRVTYELMEAWRPDEDGALADWVEPWMEPFARTIGDIPKIVASSTLVATGWNTEVIAPDDLVRTVHALKAGSGPGIALGGVTMPLELARRGLIDEYQLVVHPVVIGAGPRLFDGLTDALRLTLVDETDLGAGVVARRFVPAE